MQHILFSIENSVARITFNRPQVFNSMNHPMRQEILEALVDGLSYKMIAAKHFISTDTVKNHIQGIYRKLHVNSKGEAISLALKKGFAGNRL